MKVGDKVRVTGHDKNGYRHGFHISDIGHIMVIDDEDGSILINSDVSPYDQWMTASELEIVQ
jgi:hypothetical protein